MYDVVRIISTLQQLCLHPPAYILENVAFQLHRNSSISQLDFSTVCSIIGTPLLVDAAQFGSYAHRLRNLWTNLDSTARLQAAISMVQRPPGRQVHQALQPGRVAMPVHRTDQPPQYVCNIAGQPREAMPTLMSKPSSYAFRPGQPGCVIDCSNPMQPVFIEPTADEREVMLGYLPGSTAAEAVIERQRCSVLG